MVASSSSGTIFKLDILGFAKNLLLEVDSIRSYVPMVGDDSQPADARPSESRANAFFRLVGLPMVVSISPKNDKDKTTTKASQRVMTPGFLQGGQPEGLVANSKDAKMADPRTGQSVALNTLLKDRESKTLDLEKQIGMPERDKRRAKAFYSPMDLQLDVDTEDSNKSIVFKRISPFIVSYAPIYPGHNELSKPFLADPESGRPPPSSTPIRRPFIETAIRIRLAILGGGNQAQEDYLAGVRANMEQLSQTAASLVPTESSLYEAFIIDQMLGAIDQFADLWVNLQRRRERITTDSSILLKPKTSSAKANAFGKQGNFSLDLEVSDQSELGQRRSTLNRSIAVSEAMLRLLPTEDIVSLSGEKTKNIMPNALTNPFVTMLRQPIEQQRKKLAQTSAQLDAITQQADRLRLETEMMTGEFSGLSMPDAVFTILGLFLIDPNDLVGLLDQETLDEMAKDSVLEAALAGASPTPTLKAAKNLQDKVTDLYKTMKSAIGLRLNRDERTSRSSTTKATDEIVRSLNPQRAVDDTLKEQ